MILNFVDFVESVTKGMDKDSKWCLRVPCDDKKQQVAILQYFSPSTAIENMTKHAYSSHIATR